MSGEFMKREKRAVSWFGKLPCVGDFCSNNMSEPLLNALDLWLSAAMQNGHEKHGAAWTNAYYQAPMHGFLLGGKALPALSGQSAVGVIMPSVDKAGRAFPFVLMEQLDSALTTRPNHEELARWFLQAHTLCASALDEEWTLKRFGDALDLLPELQSTHALTTEDTDSHWYRLEFSGSVQWLTRYQGLPDISAFETLFGLNTAP
ncbi:Type VI secretion system-associated protein TagF [Limnobacter sp. 130]|nr:Type VI secretion system-associated protein TagF [Limnobacter sp. 130]